MGCKVSPQDLFTGHIVPEQEHVVSSRQGHPRLWEHYIQKKGYLISRYSGRATAAPVRMCLTEATYECKAYF